METNNFDSFRSLRLYRQFYIAYQKLSALVSDFIMLISPIWHTLSAKSLPADNEMVEIRQMVSAQLTVIQSSDIAVQTAPELLFNRLSF